MPQWLTWLALVVLAWCLLALVAGLGFGRLLRAATQERARVQGWR